MRKGLLVYFLFSVLVLAWFVGQTPPAKADPPYPQKSWVMTFRDEFYGPTLDTWRRWHTTFPNGRRSTPSNGEKEWYVDNAFEFVNGVLRIRAEKKQTGDYPYTSGMLATWGKFSQRYGYFEMRAKLPKGKGLWPAFWLLPADGKWPPEIDIMENIGHRPQVVYFSNHYILNNKHVGTTQPYIGPDFSAAFHVFGLEWRSDALIYYIDGIERYRFKENIPQVSMYILANLAVGGYWPGNPDEYTKFPAYYEIDYIRVYQKQGG